MDEIKIIKRNIFIFTVFVTASGWLAYWVDKLTGQANYENVGTITEGGSLGLLIWLVSPLLCTIILRTFAVEGWKNAGFSFNFKGNLKLYLISFMIYPTVTVIVILLGLLTGGIKFSNSTNITLVAYIGILLTQFGAQFIKNIFEESVWGAYLTNRLLKLKLSDLKLYLLVGVIWWVWHLPYIMIFLSDKEVYDVLPVGKFTFFLIGTAVVTCWTVMYTEIFRLTKSIWPLVILHAMEDAVINPLLLFGIVSVEKSQAFFFSLSVGIVPTALYLVIGLCLRKYRKSQEYS